MQISGEALFNQSRTLIEEAAKLPPNSPEFNQKLFHAEEGLNKLLNETIHQEGSVGHILFYLACVQMKRQAHAMAIIVFREAIKHKPDFIEAMSNLGFVYKEVGLFDEAGKCFKKVWEMVKKNPDGIPPKDKSDYLTNIGSLLIQNGTPKEALKYFNDALALEGCGDTTKWNKALALLELGEYEEGFELYDFGSRMERTKDRKYGKPDIKEWDGTKGQTVVVYGEQGIGDEIMFSSAISDLQKDCNIIIDCHPRLIDLFRVNFPGVPVYGTRKTPEEDIAWKQFHKVDAKLAMGSLFKFYRKKESDFPRIPYWRADEAMEAKYRDKLAAMGDRPKIGFSWKGGVRSTGISQRLIPLELWLELFRLPVDWISLQYNKDLEEEVAVFEKQHGVKLNHWPETVYDYDETAGLVANLDMVISAPQSVVHLAGAMGIPTWQLTPLKAMWQCGVNGKDMPWYGTTKNYWQEKHLDWKPVMDRVKEDLCSLLQMSTDDSTSNSTATTKNTEQAAASM